jgi:plastocyanin
LFFRSLFQYPKMKFAAAIVAALASVLPVLGSNITVIVGADTNGTAALVFNPQVITANVGDLINFEFHGGNHTVTQSSFANPCTQQFNTVTQQNGFSSPFMPFDATSGQIGVFTLEVTQTANPIWFFCARKPHCHSGMYGAINPPTTGTKTFAAFAASVPNSNEPGFGITAPFTPTTNSTSTGVGTATGTAAPTGSATGSASTSTSTSGASIVSARSGATFLLAGLVASVVL